MLYICIYIYKYMYMYICIPVIFLFLSVCIYQDVCDGVLSQVIIYVLLCIFCCFQVMGLKMAQVAQSLRRMASQGARFTFTIRVGTLF